MTRLLLYCVKAKPYLYDLRYIFGTFCGCKAKQNHFENLLLNGKIVAECDFEVDEITPNTWNAETERRILKGSCLKEHQLFDYIINGDENESQNPFYAIHIKNLKIFNKPKELSEYCKYSYPNFNKDNIVEKTPQNMCRVLTKNGYSYILISIKPQWLCKILNGEKTIEIRKKVLKEMLK